MKRKRTSKIRDTKISLTNSYHYNKWLINGNQFYFIFIMKIWERQYQIGSILPYKFERDTKKPSL